MIRRHVAHFAMSLILVLTAAGSAVAQQPAPAPRQEPQVRPSVWEQPQPAQQNDFVPLKDLARDKGLLPAQQERIPAAPLVEAAYAFGWVALLVYVWSVWRRVGAVQRELTDLRRRMERQA